MLTFNFFALSGNEWAFTMVDSDPSSTSRLVKLASPQDAAVMINGLMAGQMSGLVAPVAKVLVNDEEYDPSRICPDCRRPVQLPGGSCTRCA